MTPTNLPTGWREIHNVSTLQKRVGNQVKLGAEEVVLPREGIGKVVLPREGIGEVVLPRKEHTHWLSTVKRSAMKTYIQVTYGLNRLCFGIYIVVV